MKSRISRLTGFLLEVPSSVIPNTSHTSFHRHKRSGHLSHAILPKLQFKGLIKLS
ncbi:hypothetical protein C5167_050970, partial [Papaver somniferum]